MRTGFAWKSLKRLVAGARFQSLVPFQIRFYIASILYHRGIHNFPIDTFWTDRQLNRKLTHYPALSHGLRLLLGLPRADRPAGRGPGRQRGRSEDGELFLYRAVGPPVGA